MFKAIRLVLNELVFINHLIFLCLFYIIRYIYHKIFYSNINLYNSYNEIYVNKKEDFLNVFLITINYLNVSILLFTYN